MDFRTEIEAFVSVALTLPVHSDGQQAAHRRNDRYADHGVKCIVHLPEEMLLHYQLSVVEQVNDDGLPGIGHTHQHVRYCQTATTKQVRLSFDHKHTVLIHTSVHVPVYVLCPH